MNSLLGLDIGHSGIKASLIDQFGLAVFEKEGLTACTKSDTYFEIEIGEIISTIRLIMSRFKEKNEQLYKCILSVSFSTAGESIILLDKAMNPLTNVIMGLDSRALDEAEIIKEEFGKHRLYEICGQPDADPVWPSSKLLFFKRHMPEVFSKTRHVLLLQDYIIYKLTGKLCSEPTLIATSQYYDIKSGTIWSGMLDYLGIDKEYIPPVVKSCTIVGEITKDGEDTFLIPKGVSVSAGVMDQVAGGIGAGNISGSIITETTGSVIAVSSISSDIDSIVSLNVPYLPFIDEGTYFLLPWEKTGGNLYKWWRDRFSSINGKNISYQELDLLAKEVKAGCNGMIMLPALSGSVFPVSNPSGCGVLYGIDWSTDFASVTRAVLESVAYELRDIIEAIKPLIPSHASSITSLGGGALSPLWCQIKADVIDMKISVPLHNETSALGASFIAGLSVYGREYLNNLIGTYVVDAATFVPDNDNFDSYNKNFDKYRKLRRCLNV